MSDNFRKTNANNQTTNNDENKNDEVMTFNYQPGPSSDMTENKIVVFDYTTIGMQINQNLNSFDNLNAETIDLHKLNISYEHIVETFKEKLMTKIVDGKYVMSDKYAINLDKIIGLACIAMSESEKNNKQLRTKNSILQSKYGNYDYLVKECNRLKSEMDQIKINLCLALSRRFNDKEDVIHLTNVCAALAARENEYYYIQVKNDKLKYVINKQLMNIRLSTLNNYDEILQSVEKLKEGLYIKDLKISQLEDEILYSINEEKYIQLQLLHENVFQFPDQNFHDAFDYTQNNNELYEGKMLIAEQINQIQGSSDVEFENHKLCDLINMLAKLTTDKEENLKTVNICLIKNIEDKNQQLIKEINDYKKWQIYLENENEKLNSQIKNQIMVQTILIGKQNEHNNLKQDYLKLKSMYDKLKERDLLTLLDECRQRLSDVEIKCVDGDRLIKKLQSNITEQTNKYKLVNAKYNKEKEKCQKNKIYTQQIMDEFTDRLHEKQIEIALVQNESNDLKHRIKSDKDYTWNLKCYIITLDNVLKEKNKIIHKLKTQSKQQQQQQQHTATSRSSSLLSGNHLHINSKLKEQMDILLNNVGTWKNIIVGYEKVLYNMQNAAQQQSKKSNYWIDKYQHLKDIEYKATLTENLTKEKEFILLQHQNEIEEIREKYNPIIAHMADTQVNLRNEIRDLKESLKLKNSHLMVTEKIASSQLNESLTTLQRLIKVCNIQSLILNDINNGIPERCCDTSITNTRNNISQLMEGLVDYTSKLQSENTFMKRLCEIREEKIKSFENCLCSCTGTSLHQ
ncbi:centrosomal protein of 112 kDa-like [Metopolophium dirhodum]|uniref:centrosomal protein of 112 kDa-like n=1 Tax=Metopolophium dirhodum TaxID=44670 RepID=UPI00298F52C9|nr:centrosomal protein of 112 kDa-like [Metopolophium dirhodum]